MFDAISVGVSRDVEFACHFCSVVEPAAVRGGLFPGPGFVLGTVAYKRKTDPDAVHFAAGALVLDFDGDALRACQIRNFLQFDVGSAVVDGFVGHAHDEVHVFGVGLGGVGAELGGRGGGGADVRCCGGFVVVVPAGHFVERDDSFVGEVLCPNVGGGLAYVSCAPGIVPRHPPAPCGSVFVHLGDVGDRAVFAEGDEFVRACLVREVDERGAVALVVVSLVVDVDAQDVIVGFAGAPGHRGGILRVEYPDEVVDAVREYHAFVEQLVEGRELLAGMGAPPEPVSAGFVQRAEDGGDAFFLEVEENLGDEVDVADERLVGGRDGVPVCGAGDECFGEIEFGVGLVSALDVEFHFFTWTPVPCECGNAAFFPGGLCDVDGFFCVFLEPAVVLVRAGRVHEVAADERWVLARFLEHGLDVLVLGEVAYGVCVHVAGHDAGDCLFAEVVDEKVVELDGGRCGVLCHRCVAEIERLGFVFLDFQVVDVDPAPTFGNRDGVLAGGEVHDCFDVGELAFFGLVERDRGRCSTNFDVVDFGCPVIVHVMEDDGVFARLFDGNLGKRDVPAVHLGVLAAGGFGAFAYGGVA